MQNELFLKLPTKHSTCIFSQTQSSDNYYIQRDAETLYGFHRNMQPKMYMHRKCESTELDFVGLWNALETW